MPKKALQNKSQLGFATLILVLAFSAFVIAFQSEINTDLQERITRIQTAHTTAIAAAKQALLSTQKQGAISERECGENIGECLYRVDGAYIPTGIAVVEGYYTQYPSMDWDGMAVTCDAFVITDGSDLLLAGFENLAASGSGVVPKNTDGTFVAKLNFADPVAGMSDAEIAAVKASTQTDHAELHVFAYQPSESGASACHSPFAILEIE